MKIYVILFATLFTASCSDSGDCSNANRTCYSFDVRQCATDVFADDVDETENREMREDALEGWFESEGVNIRDIKLQLDFHETVCEACDICPTGDRYFVKVDSDADLDQFDLLNLEEGDCCDLF